MMKMMSLEWLTWICINDETTCIEMAVKGLLSIEPVEYVHDNRCIRDLVGREITHPPCLDHSAIDSWLNAAVVYDPIQLLLRRRWLHHTPRRLNCSRLWLQCQSPTFIANNSSLWRSVHTSKLPSAAKASDVTAEK